VLARPRNAATRTVSRHKTGYALIKGDTGIPCVEDEESTPDRPGAVDVHLVMEDPSEHYVRRVLRKRRLRSTREHATRRSLLMRVICITAITIILLSGLLPLGVGFTAYSAYDRVSNIAYDGVNHLLAVKSLLPASKNDLLSALDVKRLQAAQAEFTKAEDDFLQITQIVNRPEVQSAVNQFSPDYSRKLQMTKHLVQMALDVSRMGQEMTGIGIMVASIIHSSPLVSTSNRPLISVSNISAIEGAMTHAIYYIDDINAQMRYVQFNELPISDRQKAQLVTVLGQLPQIRQLITRGQSLIEPVAWLLGVGHMRRFLVQTMDRGELRPSGGFTGQYGVLQIENGRMAPFSLRDVAQLDYAGNGMELGRSAPPAYSWMNFGNWGLRDSNLSGDYPTTARMSMQVFQEEGGGPVDGDISFTPTFISHILDVTGPIRVAEYHETITPKNLEDRLHYYQQNFSAIAVQQQKTNNYTHSARKTFTTLVGKLLLDRVRHLSPRQLLDVVKGAVKDLQSHDLEVYFAHPLVEQWLAEHDYSASIDSFDKRDGFTVVQANISISKASQYVHTTEQDNIVLDASGGATHNLMITLDYQQTGPVYGFNTYADYLRVYVPRSAQYISGDGFDSGQCLISDAQCCNTSNGKDKNHSQSQCAAYKTSFPDDARYCPGGDYDLGMRGGVNHPWPLDALSGPTAMQSDLPGRAMWGGLTLTPKNCSSRITISWYVPHVVDFTGSRPGYTFLVQKQGGYVPAVQINVDSRALKGMKSLSYKGDLTADKMLAIAQR
jgi:Protein of unknown function (DUF4012)